MKREAQAEGETLIKIDREIGVKALHLRLFGDITWSSGQWGAADRDQRGNRMNKRKRRRRRWRKIERGSKEKVEKNRIE
jgi:hypothetical protein